MVEVTDGDGSIVFGSDIYGSGNQLNQKTLTITDNFEIYKEKHTITIGTHNEFYSIYNLFMRGAYGYYYYDDVSSFLSTDSVPSEYGVVYSLVDDVRGDGSKAAADFNFMQFGFYVQDEYQMSDNFKISAGLRIDIPVFTVDPAGIDGFNDTTITKLEAYYDLKGAQAGKMPKSQFMFSPRIGFNWDVFGDNTTQLRGGIGIFTSRVPFVWPGGSYTNNGLTIGEHKMDTLITFNHNWETQVIGSTETPSGSQIDIYAENFKFPQMFRTNIALDKKLPYDIVATIDLLYTKTINNVLWKDVNVKPPYGSANDSTTSLPDNRPLFNTYKNGIESNYGQIMLGDNTSKGHTYSLTAQVSKKFDLGLDMSFAYTYSKAKSIFDGTSSQNSSQWNYLTASPTPKNEAILGVSNFDMGSRIVVSISYEKEFINHLKTTVSLFYIGQTGMPFSYIYNDKYGVFSGEGYKTPQLIYIPDNQSDIIFEGTPQEQQTQWDELDAYIKQDAYLSENRGKYAERNAARLPWSNNIDLHFAQEMFTDLNGTKQTIQITFDVFNLGNMINKDWGMRYYAYKNNISLIKFEGFQSDDTTPEFSFTRPDNDEPWELDDSGVVSSRWYAQLGIRYNF